MLFPRCSSPDDQKKAVNNNTDIQKNFNFSDFPYMRKIRQNPYTVPFLKGKVNCPRVYLPRRLKKDMAAGTIIRERTVDVTIPPMIT